MLPKIHIILGAIFSFLIWLIFPVVGLLDALIIFLSSVLIDFDHYLSYAIKKKDYNLKRAYHWFIDKRKFVLSLNKKEREKYKHTIIIFHGIECIVLLILLTFFHKIFLFVLIGMGIHLILDFIDLYFWKIPFYTKLSQIYTHHKNNGKKSS